MKAYKGFNRDMTCRDFKYEEGKEYTTPKAKCCSTGFHACEYPLDCLDYYDPGDGSVYHEVELDGDIDHDGCDTKVAATKIKIGAQLSIAGLVKAAIDYTMKRIKREAKADKNHAACSATGYNSACSATGDNSACSATGDNSACSATGDNSACSATGDKSACSATGDNSACSATGDKSACSATGDKSACSADNPTAIAVAWGFYSRAKGVIGAHIVLADWRMDENYNWHLHGAQMVRIDGKQYKADTWYRMENGKIVEVSV